MHPPLTMAISLPTRLPFLLIVIIPYVASEKFYIITSPGQPCPRKSIEEQCLTLQQFVRGEYNSSWNYVYSETSQLNLELQPGIHTLVRTTLVISWTHTGWLVMNSSDASIICTSNSGFEFQRVQFVKISGINFTNCGGPDISYANSFAIENCNFFNHQRGWNLESILNATVVRTSFFNGQQGPVLTVARSSLLLKMTLFMNFSRKSGRCQGGVIDCQSSVLTIEQSAFLHNSIDCIGIYGIGGAIYSYNANVSITNSDFINNSALYSGGTAYITGGFLGIFNSSFSYNSAQYRTGGALYIGSVRSVFIKSSSFLSNTATSNINYQAQGSGGAIYIAAGHVNFSLIYTIFINNLAAFCAVLNIKGSHHTLNIIRSNFTHNRESRMVKYSGYTQFSGVACIKDSNISVISSIFTENEAAGHAGVFHAENSTLRIQKSFFSRNKAGRDGGVIFSQLSYTIVSVNQSSFTYNQAGGDGGVIYMRSLGNIGNSEVTVSRSTFSFNSAGRRGGVISVTGGQVDIGSSGTKIHNNTAGLGGVMSACVSEVIVQNELLISEDPTNPQLCTFYDTDNTSKVVVTTSSSDNLSSTLNATLSISVIVWILVLILYTIVVCIILYLCGALKCKREKSSDVHDDHVYIQLNK